MTGTFKGTIYSFKNPPENAFYQLKRNEILAMNLIGLPICVQHYNNPVGTVVAASMSEDSADIEWRLNEDASGWAAEALIHNGAARELSLKHNKNPDGSLTPLEVSLCLKGARPDTKIQNDNINTLGGVSLKEVAASAMSTEAPPVVPPEAPPAETIFPGDAAPVDEPASKKLKLDDGDAHMAFVQDLATKITDKETLQSVIDYVGANMQQFVETKAEMNKLMEAKNALEKAVDVGKESSKNVVSDITKVLMQLYGSYAPHSKISDSQREEFVNHISANPVALDVLKPILVAASSIYDDHARKEREAAAASQAAQFAKLQALRDQMGKMAKNGSPVNIQAVQPPAPVQPSWQMAAPAVTIAASANAPAPHRSELDMLRSMQLPPMLAGLTAFQGQIGRVKDQRGNIL